jgi:preprotein translocase subunit SecA
MVARAGQKATIRIATNMAGRGTDMILGGNINFQIQKELYDILTLSRNYTLLKKIDIFKSDLKTSVFYKSQKFLSVLFSLLTDNNFLKLSDINILRSLQENDNLILPTTVYQSAIKFLINELNSDYKKHQGQENKIIKNLGGLYIIGTERNDSRRVDNQLRGRCGRQGDPGVSRFFLSLDDNLLRLFGGPKIQTFLQSQLIDDTPLESNMLTKSLDSAQQQVEERAYQQRKNLFDYDDILNKQRSIVYFERQLILRAISQKKNMMAYCEQIVTDILQELQNKKSVNSQLLQLLENLLGEILSIKYLPNLESLTEQFNLTELKIYFFNELWLSYQARINALSVYGEGICENIERSLILINIDRIWREHLQKMTLLREAVGWRGYGQRNPLYEYKQDAFYIFEARKEFLRHLVIYDLLRSYIL